MKLIVDCRMIDASGVGVYIRGCLPYFLNSSHQCILLGDAEKLTPLIKPYKNAESIPCTIKPFSVQELLFFPRRIKNRINTADLFYSPFFNIPPGIRVPVYTTIHDIIFPDMPELFSPAGLALRMVFLKRAYRRSTKIFTVSGFSKSRIEHFLGNDKPVIVTYSAVLPSLLEQDIENTKKKSFILFIGNIKKHKGLWCLLDAFFRAKAEGLREKLIIVGNKDNFRSSDTEALKKLEGIDPSLVEFTGHISETQLKELLTEAALLVQPSLYEGFGLPPLEAMTRGARVLISDIPVFKEIYADFPVVFFRAGDSGDLKKKLMELLSQKEPERMVLPGFLSSKYTFKKTASLILDGLTGSAAGGVD
ncbi:MAG: glycosyltransferase family 4 protein [Spirochaetaceae bacterium]|jgi:glycosyltransferase involved in cell wall biosynthesis|nr:glycosyltransferase family 4 protein [Spirochaetaceae bacterium]